MTLIALAAGLGYPSAAAGLDSLRLRQTSDSIVSFLNTAVDRAERRQQVIEIVISPRDNLLTARSPDLEFQRRLDINDPVRIVSIRPLLRNWAPDDPVHQQPRRFIIYPGGAMPRIAVEIANKQGRRRLVSIDPISGFPHVELLAP